MTTIRLSSHYKDCLQALEKLLADGKIPESARPRLEKKRPNCCGEIEGLGIHVRTESHRRGVGGASRPCRGRIMRDEKTVETSKTAVKPLGQQMTSRSRLATRG
jgi:hypothetical protein